MGLQRVMEPEGQQQPLSPRVLVGFDGSRGSWAALGWARREAVARCVQLRVAKSSAMPAFIATAAAADLLVLGSSDELSGRSFLRRSVSGTAARRSPCPVVVVRGTRTGAVRRIVVGVDGSSAAAAAVDWACEEATVHGAELCVVHVSARDVAQTEEERLLDEAMTECRERTNAIVSGLLVEGAAGPELIEVSHDADLIAIGSRGRSGFKTALFGSVALTVAENADCPVVVTYPRLRPTREG